MKTKKKKENDLLASIPEPLVIKLTSDGCAVQTAYAKGTLSKSGKVLLITLADGQSFQVPIHFLPQLTSVCLKTMELQNAKV